MEESRPDHIERVKHCTRKRPRHERFLPTQRLTVTAGNTPGVTLWDVGAQWWDLRLWRVVSVGCIKCLDLSLLFLSFLPLLFFPLPFLSYPVLSFKKAVFCYTMTSVLAELDSWYLGWSPGCLVDSPLEWQCKVLGWGSQKANTLIKFHGSMWVTWRAMIWGGFCAKWLLW